MSDIIHLSFDVYNNPPPDVHLHQICTVPSRPTSTFGLYICSLTCTGSQHSLDPSNDCPILKRTTPATSIMFRRTALNYSFCLLFGGHDRMTCGMEHDQHAPGAVRFRCKCSVSAVHSSSLEFCERILYQRNQSALSSFGVVADLLLNPVTFLTLLAVVPLSLPCFDSIAASFITLGTNQY